MSKYAAPATPSGLSYEALKGSLLLVQVLGVEEHVPTVHTQPGQKTPAVRATVSVLDGEESGSQYEDTLIFPKVLQSQLRGRVGELVLGRLTQGNAKPGQNAPWILQAATEEDVAVADAFVRKAATPSVSTAEAPF